MINTLKYTSLLLLLVSMTFACESKPKIIVAEDTQSENPHVATDESSNQLHKVVAEEVLHTSRYTYMHVVEEGQKSWIAIPRKEVETGVTYYYRGGLKKVNFNSAELDRTFETVYLVSDVSTDPNLSSGMTMQEGHGQIAESQATGDIQAPPGGISLAELLANKKKYEGQTVKVRGKCVKVNNMIMNRNWVHIRDASLTDENEDLTLTTTDVVALGAVVAFEGKITLNKDFGAGYKYEIIMEEAKLLQ